MIGGVRIYYTGPFSRQLLNAKRFSDFSCAYDYTLKSLRRLEFMALFSGTNSPRTCFGFESTFKDPSLPVTCPSRGKETVNTLSANGPIMNVTGCIDDTIISSMKVNG